MRIAKTLSVLMILLSILVVGAAQAAPRGKSQRRSMVVRVPIARDLINESEPNDDCATANPVSPGDLVSATIDPIGDHDNFEITVDAGDIMYFRTILQDGVPGMLEDSELYLYASDCVTELAYNDDMIDFESEIVYEFVDAGVYYILVVGYGDDEGGSYELEVGEIVAIPVGETCQDATSIPNGGFSFSATTTGMSDDYEYTWFGSDSPDAVFGFTLPSALTFTCRLDVTGTDFIIYLVTDCSDIEGSLLAFSDDDPENIDYTNATGEAQLIYLIVDGFFHGDAGGFIMSGFNEGSGLVAVTPMSWGDVKTRY